MSISPKNMIERIIRPALKDVRMYSLGAEQLIAGTFAVESDFGTYIIQGSNGPALGIGQMEPFTHIDIYNNYLNTRPNLKELILSSCGYSFDSFNNDYLVHNLRYATIMTRLKYYRDPCSLPAFNDVKRQADYWKRVYNTPKGKGRMEDYLIKFNKYLREYYFG